MFLEILLVTSILLFIIRIIRFGTFGFGPDPFDYWKTKGVASPETSIQKQHNWNSKTRKKAMAYQYLTEYNMMKGAKFYGRFDGLNQLLIIRDDFELIESILVKDFDYFQKTSFSRLRDTIPVNRTEEIFFKERKIFIIGN